MPNQKTQQARSKAYTLYMEAVKAKNNVAAIRLLDWVADPKSEFYDTRIGR